jgi:hypothetical protein
MANFQIAEKFSQCDPRGEFFGVFEPLLRPKKAKKVYRNWSGFQSGPAMTAGRGSWTVGQKTKKTFRGARNSRVGRRRER